MQSDWQQKLEPAQRARLSHFSADAAIDIHSHILPGLDDGPQSMPEALDLCRSLVADGITHVIATPHQLGPYSGSNRARDILDRVSALQNTLPQAAIPLLVEPGADVRIDEQLLALVNRGEVLTLRNHKSYILLEFPHETLIDIRQLLQQLAQQKIRGIITHPERHPGICRKLHVVIPWISHGAILQVTAGSLLGDFGPQAHITAWQLIEAGAVSLIASDAHDVIKRPPRMTAAIAAITGRLGHAVARRLCIENPEKVFQNQSISPPRVSRRFEGIH